MGRTYIPKTGRGRGATCDPSPGLGSRDTHVLPMTFSNGFEEMELAVRKGHNSTCLLGRIPETGDQHKERTQRSARVLLVSSAESTQVKKLHKALGEKITYMDQKELFRVFTKDKNHSLLMGQSRESSLIVGSG